MTARNPYVLPFDLFYEEPWEELARCANLPMRDYDPFYPGPGGGREAYETAKRICAPCPVKAECLALALKIESDSYKRYGCWGGLTPEERDKIARSSKRKSRHIKKETVA